MNHKQALAEALNASERSDGQGLDQIGSCLAEILRRTLRPVLAKQARAWSLPAEDVEDILQQTALGFIEACRQRRVRPDAATGLHTADSVGRYLHGIAHHNLHGALRRARRNQDGQSQALARIAAALLETASGSDSQSEVERLESLRVQAEQIYGMLCQRQLASEAAARAADRFVRTATTAGQLQRLALALRPAELVASLLMQAAAGEGAAALALRLRPESKGQQAVDEEQIVQAAVRVEPGGAADERLWLRLRELSAECRSQDIVLSYLIFSGVGPGTLRAVLRSSINTPRNSLKRVLKVLKNRAARGEWRV